MRFAGSEWSSPVHVPASEITNHPSTWFFLNPFSTLGFAFFLCLWDKVLLSSSLFSLFVSLAPQFDTQLFLFQQLKKLLQYLINQLILIYIKTKTQTWLKKQFAIGSTSTRRYVLLLATPKPWLQLIHMWSMHFKLYMIGLVNFFLCMLVQRGSLIYF